MLSSSLLSTFHLFALALGLPGVALRGVALRSLRTEPSAMKWVLRADAAWGLAAALWLATGLTRAFGPFEKGSAYYLSSGFFLVKLGLFASIVALEIRPIITFTRWRALTARNQPVDLTSLPSLIRLNDAELALTLLIPFFASAMARGLGPMIH